MSYDVIVVGAGPAGSAAAEACARLGLSTLCIEEHGTIGNPVQCAGLLSNAAFAECRTSLRPVLTTVSGARVISGRGNEFLIDARCTKAFVVDRCALDREMAETAADAGVEFRLKTSVFNVMGNTVQTRGVGGREEFMCRILIAADGPRSTIARIHGMQRARVYLSGIQADLPGDYDPRFVSLFPDASPEFFGWVIPTGKGRIRVGLCGKTEIPGRFDAFVRKFGTNSIQIVTGTLPLGVMPKTYGHRTLFVGDSAGFAKPTSGGGIYTGVRAARHAAVVAAEACEQNRFDDPILAGYERLWKADFGKELDVGFRLFAIRQKMSPDQIDAAIRACNDPDILSAIVRHGDMDRPAAIAAILLKKPAVLGCLGSVISAGIRSYLS